MNSAKFESDVKKYWKSIDLMNKVRQQKENNKNSKWVFLDGPPFINGNPHYGHLLVSTIKDVMARIMSQQGFQISYQIGFDCHGLPIEQEAEKITNNNILDKSNENIKNFNNICKDIISNCSQIWFNTLEKLGRQFDYKETYYTSSLSYMEVSWWAFKELWKKDLIYKAKKVMPYSPQCQTVLSNFEANLNYKEKSDISIYVKFKLIDVDEYLVIWTTTPWSLIANQAICVNPKFKYILIEYEDEKLWVGDFCKDELFNLKSYKIIDEKLGSELIGKKYYPIYKLDNYNNYQVVGDTFIKDNSSAEKNHTSTGLVHLAPLFGAEDMKVLLLNNYSYNDIPNIVDSLVKITIDLIINNQNIKYKFIMDITNDIIADLKNTNKLFKTVRIKHKYPHCWRTDLPLIYLASESWFLNVKKILPELLENNKKITWFPPYVGTERFANWIADAQDWCLSRSRIWGTPIPIWSSQDGDILCIGSIEELELYTHTKISDIHSDNIYNTTIYYNGKIYKSSNQVLDCWFESGLAPIARNGYPMCKSSELPVDFIAESLDQTRGWFYTLNVLSTALFNKPAFKKVIVSGMVLAHDGKKMSKRLQNYTSPDIILDNFGSDVLRLYFLNSIACKAESFCFKDKDIFEVTKKLIPYYNAHVFLLDIIENSKEMLNNNFEEFNQILINYSDNKIDEFILSEFLSLTKNIYKYINSQDLSIIPNLLFNFIDCFTNSYIKLSKNRLKLVSSIKESINSITTLIRITIHFNILLSSFIPHLSEYYFLMLKNNKIIKNLNIPYLYSSNSFLNLNQIESCHMIEIDLSVIENFIIDKSILDNFREVESLLECVRNLRHKNNRLISYPIFSLTIYTDNLSLEDQFKDIIIQELNIKNLYIIDIRNLQSSYKPIKGIIGKIFKQHANTIIEYITNCSNNNSLQEVNFELDIATIVEKINLNPNDYSLIQYIPSNCYTKYYIAEEKTNIIYDTCLYYSTDNTPKQVIVHIDLLTNSILDEEADCNIIRRQINMLRKELGLKLYDPVIIYFEDNNFWSTVSNRFIDNLKIQLGIPFEILPYNKIPEYNNSIIVKSYNNTDLKVYIKLLDKN